MIHFQWFQFSDLSPYQLYDILVLRSEVFVIEQNCLYMDADGKDSEAIHLLGMQDETLAAYLRLFPPTEIESYISFGRVVTNRHVRGKGHGKQLLQTLFDYCDAHYPGITIRCSAQLYLKAFYESFGLKAHGEVYQEDGIPHIAMSK